MTRPPVEPWAMPSLWTSPSASPPSSSSRPTAVRTTGGWEITVYYTAVERFHDGEPEEVSGCLRLDCTDGDDDLGTYPSDFVAAVRDEGTGRTAGGKYLNWSYDVGFWLDSAARDTGGRQLRPFVSAAADPGVLPRDSTFQITECGRQDDGSRAATSVCAALRGATWTVTDEFTPGLGGSKHIDVYIGPETGPDFTDSDWYVALTGAKLLTG